jgi:carboxyl-terminal processing protease
MRILIGIFVSLTFWVSTYSQTTLLESQKIATFSKLWGFLKYYHPTVAKGKIDWDKEFTERIKVVTSLKSKHEINSYYSDWIDGLGKVKNCKKCKNEIAGSLKFNLDLAWLSDSGIFSNDLSNKLQFILHNRNQGKNHYVTKFMFIGNTKNGEEKPYKDSVFPTIELRLLGLSRYWNIINYFFPYKYRIGRDWDSVLVEMIPKFRDSEDTLSYHLAMLELTAKINDSHAGLATKYTNRYFGNKWAPFKFKIIDNKAIVTGYYDDSLCIKNDIRYGDVFLKVGGQPVGDIIEARSKYIGASNDAAKIRNCYYAIFNGQTDSVNATYERNGLIAGKTINRYPFKDYKYDRTKDNKNDTCKILDGNIGYVNLGLLQRKKTKGCLNKLKDTKAIIFDVRNYPNGTMYQIAKFLNTERRPFAKFTIPDVSYPGVYHFTPPYLCGRKNKNAYQGKVILLFNEETQSHAEFTLMALQTASNVIGIGSQTAGADGNISMIIFPGNYKTYMSGLGVYYPDGRETQRIGIVPDIEIKPTIEGLKTKKDEVLEKAIEVISRK